MTSLVEVEEVQDTRDMVEGVDIIRDTLRHQVDSVMQEQEVKRVLRMKNEGNLRITLGNIHRGDRVRGVQRVKKRVLGMIHLLRELDEGMII